MFKVWLTLFLTVVGLVGTVVLGVMGQWAIAAGALVTTIIFGGLVAIVLAKEFRVVVAPSEVHTVQSGSERISYGTVNKAKLLEGVEDAETWDIAEMKGNSYYRFPEWWPKVGITVVEMPLSVFSENLDRYNAYDSNRVPFEVDIMAFFRVANPAVASERIESFDELLGNNGHLNGILQGAARKLLASFTVEHIMHARKELSKEFTDEVRDQLREWGVVTVKDIEIMDIRDPADESSKVIHNIMAMEQSRIDRESREVVAENTKLAEVAETNAKRDSDLAVEAAEQQVGEREAEKKKAVGVADEQALQEIKREAAVTMERDMEVKRVEEEKNAEINKNVEVIKATEQKEVTIVNSEAEREQQAIVADGYKTEKTLQSEGDLTADRNIAAGIQAKGEAEADAKFRLNMADVDPEITLAKEVGENDGYQRFLNTGKAIDANKEVGVATAGALENGDLKVIVNGGSANEGVNNLMSLFDGSGGGQQLGAIVDGMLNTEGGAALLSRLGVTPAEPSEKPTVAKDTPSTPSKGEESGTNAA